MKYIELLIAILEGAILLCLLISICHASKNKRNICPNKCDCYSTRILVIIPAHNEEGLIENTIMALKDAKYPEKLLDIVLLADRCTDNTAVIARKKGVFVCEDLENYNNTKSGVLKWYFEKNLNTLKRYDYICIVDADTLVNKDFFIVADQQFKKGHKIVQGKISVINQAHSSVSGFMTIFQSVINVFFYEHLNNFNESVLIAGKGMLISPSVFDHIMWNSNALIEDVDFSFQAILLGIPIVYCKEMKAMWIQPNTLEDMWNQQRRWISGQNQIIKRYAKRLMRGELSGGAKTFVIEGIVSVAVFPIVLAGFICSLKCVYLILSYYIIAILIAVSAIRIDNAQRQVSIRDIYVFPIILVYWYIINVISFLKPIKLWGDLAYKSRG